MPREGRNTHHISRFKDGYVLPSGKRLSREDADTIGREAGLNTTHIADDNVDYLNPEWLTCPKTGEKTLIHNCPVYRPYIDENAPTPPMLQFFSSSPGLKPLSAYTINLNTLKPTSKSPVQKGIPEHILMKLR